MNYLPGNYIDFGAPEALQHIKEVAVEPTLGAAHVAETTLVQGREWLAIENEAIEDELSQERFDPDAYPELTHLVHEDIRNKIYHGTERTRRGALQELARRSFREIGLVEEYAKYVDFDRHSHIVGLLSGHLKSKLSHANQDLNSYDVRDGDLMEAIALTYAENDDIEGGREYLQNVKTEGSEVALRGLGTEQRATDMLIKYFGSPVDTEHEERSVADSKNPSSDASIAAAKKEEEEAMERFRPSAASYGVDATRDQVEVR